MDGHDIIKILVNILQDRHELPTDANILNILREMNSHELAKMMNKGD